MASEKYANLLTKTYAGVVTNEKSTTVELTNNAQDLIFQIITTNRTAGSITALIEDSIDGVNWATLVSFTAAIATNTVERKYPTTAVGKYIRTSVTTAALSDMTAVIDVAAELKKS